MVLSIGIFQLCIISLLYFVYSQHFEPTINSDVLFVVHYFHNSGHFSFPGLLSIDSQTGMLSCPCSSDTGSCPFYKDPGTQVLFASCVVIMLAGILLFSCYLMKSLFLSVQQLRSTSIQQDLDDRVEDVGGLLPDGDVVPDEVDVGGALGHG